MNASALGKVMPTIMSGLAIIGLAATAYFTAKKSRDVDIVLDNELYDKIEREVKKNPDLDTTTVALTKTETLKAGAKLYWPAIACGLGTVTCIVTANKIGAAQIAALSGGIAYLSTHSRDIKWKLKSTLGYETYDKLTDEIDKTKTKAMKSIDDLKKGQSKQVKRLVDKSNDICLVIDDSTGMMFVADSKEKLNEGLRKSTEFYNENGFLDFRDMVEYCSGLMYMQQANDDKAINMGFSKWQYNDINAMYKNRGFSDDKLPYQDPEHLEFKLKELDDDEVKGKPYKTYKLSYSLEPEWGFEDY